MRAKFFYLTPSGTNLDDLHHKVGLTVEYPLHPILSPEAIRMLLKYAADHVEIPADLGSPSKQNPT